MLFFDNSLFCRFVSFPPAALLDDQSVCGRGERLALALARENINSQMVDSSQARVEVDVYELEKDSQYDTTDTSKICRWAFVHVPAENSEAAAFPSH